jgi:hypothetical protein
LIKMDWWKAPTGLSATVVALESPVVSLGRMGWWEGPPEV